jgi:hypothetical protein
MESKGKQRKWHTILLLLRPIQEGIDHADGAIADGGAWN